MLKAVNNVFVQLADSLQQLSQEQFIQPCVHLSGSTIGQHVRHIIEMFHCLDIGYESGLVDYEKRKRDKAIETSKAHATELLTAVFYALHRENKPLQLATYYDDLCPDPVLIDSNYYRELTYNLEHTIHHMALIRVGLREVSDIQISDDYGIAASTLKHRRECAQ